MSVKRLDLGAVSAYALAVEQGYQGTEEEFGLILANAANYASDSKDAKEAAENAAGEAAESARFAERKLGEVNAAASERIREIGNEAEIQKESAKAEIAEKGKEVLESILEDYQAMQEDVSKLNGEIGNLVSKKQGTENSGKALIVDENGNVICGEVAKVVPGRGTAVVFGDSYFNNPTVGYEFGDWLANQGVYNTVYNHAYEGSGFGNTYQYISGYSLYELLISGSATGKTPDGKTNYADIRQHVREADAIYIHLGGNDVFSQGGKLAEVKVENDLQNKVKLCLEKINEFNNHAVIYYALPGTVSEYATMKKAIVPSMCDDGEPYDKLLRRIYSIQIAVAKSDANVVISKSKGSDFVYRMGDTLHYTKECAEIFFDRLLYGDYGTKYITDFYINAPNDVTSETDVSTISGLITDGIVANTPKLAYCTLSENIVYTNVFTQEHVDPYLYRFSFENYMSQYGGFIKLYLAFKKDGTFEAKGYLLQSTQLN